MFRSVIPAILAVALTACGGGGGNQSAAPSNVFELSSPLLGDSSKHRSAILDFRFDQSDLNQQGFEVNSFHAVKPIVDQIKATGFDTLTFQTNIPIDPATGQLVFFDPNPSHYNRDKRLPKDFWPLVRYAKQKGLKVAVKAEPVNYVNDETISDLSYARFFTPTFVANFFNSLLTYQRELGLLAQQNGVDIFYVGYQNIGLDSAAYESNWTAVVTNLRQVFSGKLIYTTCYRCINNVVWNKVDIIGLEFNPDLSSVPVYDSRQILSMYNNPVMFDGRSSITLIKDLARQYSKPILLDGVRIHLADIAVSTRSDYWDNNNLPSGSSQNLNYDLARARYVALFELISGALNNTVSGVAIGEYAPWLEANWIQQPTNSVGTMFYQYQQGAGSVYKNTFVETLLSGYLLKAWNYCVLCVANP